MAAKQPSRPRPAPVRARGLAAQVVARVVEQGAYANLALSAALTRQSLQGPERGFCTELVYGTLRHLHRLDGALQRASERPVARIQPELLNLARVAAYEALVLGSADHALVHEAVDLARAVRGEGGARFLNGLLRGLLRQRDAGTLLPSQVPGVDGLVERSGLPRWLAQDVTERLGAEEAERFGAASLVRPALNLCVPAGREARDQAVQDLVNAGQQAHAHPLVETGVVLDQSVGAVEELGPVQAGRAFVQDAASQVVAAWAAAVARERGAPPRVLDLCAAPGGKSAVLAARGLGVVSGDIHLDKLLLARRQWRRLGVGPLAVALDAAQPPFAPECADLVLLDAPCTGTGLLARRPEIKLRRSAEDVERLAHLQETLLDSAATLVRAGGSILYSVCAVSQREGPEQVRRFLARHPGWQGVAGTGRTPEEALEHGMLALWPQRHGTDGFFAAHLQRGP